MNELPATKGRQGASWWQATRRRALSWAAGAALGAAALLGLGGLNTSASLPRGLYLEIPRGWRERGPAHGDLVLACAPAAGAELARRRGYLGDGPCGAGAAGGAAALGKVVLAAGGDEVAFGPGGLTVNGRAVAASRALSRDTAGRPLAHFPFGRLRLAPGEVWLFSPCHPRSYDSRYFGPVAAAAVRAWLLPVVVANDDRLPELRIHRFHLSAIVKPEGR
jgi:conjugative transfer signal peptidase TraF